jgi:hypothetical protein
MVKLFQVELDIMKIEGEVLALEGKLLLAQMVRQICRRHSGLVVILFLRVRFAQE